MMMHRISPNAVRGKFTKRGVLATNQVCFIYASIKVDFRSRTFIEKRGILIALHCLDFSLRDGAMNRQQRRKFVRRHAYVG